MAPVQQKSTGKQPQVQPDHPAFPARWRYGLYVISPGNRAFLPPSFAGAVKRSELDTSVGVSGPHDFAVRADGARGAPSSRPSHPRLTFGDDWPKRPLHQGGMTGDNHIFLENGSEIFGAVSWTPGSALHRVANIAFFARNFRAECGQTTHFPGAIQPVSASTGESVCTMKVELVPYRRCAPSPACGGGLGWGTKLRATSGDPPRVDGRRQALLQCLSGGAAARSIRATMTAASALLAALARIGSS